MRPISCFLFLLTLVFGLPAVAQANETSSLVERGKALRESFQEKQNQHVSIEGLDKVFLACADSLKAAGQDSLASLLVHDAGWAMFYTGRREEGRVLWVQELESAEAFGVPEVLAPLMNSVGVGYAATGNMEGGLEVWEKLIPLRWELGDTLGAGRTMGNMANAYALLGRIPEALEMTTKAVETDRLSGNSRGIMNGHHRRAGLYHDLGRLQEALAESDKALELGLASNARSLESMYLRRSTIRFDLGQTEGAIEDMDRSIELTRAVGNQAGEAYSQVNLAMMHSNMGNNQKAVDLLEQASEFIASIGDTVVYHRTLVPKAEAYRKLGKTQKAKELLADALEHYEEWRRRQTDPTSAAGLFLRGSDVYACLALVARDEGDLAKAWNMCERGRSFVLKERLAPRAFEEPMDLSEVQEFLARANGTLIHYSDPTIGALYRFVITPTDIRMDGISSVQPLALEAHNILDLFATGETDAVCEPGLERLGEELLGDKDAPFEIHGERVYIVPPSQLEGFPFETLLLDGVPFGDQFAVTYLPSASTLRMEQAAPAAGMLAVADPISDGAQTNTTVTEVFRGLRETPLPYAREEVEAIKSLEAVVLLGEEASRENLLGQLENPFAVLHIATHTLVDPVNPARSALVLAQDGTLSAEELEALSVQCDLVTLSGCQTSGGFTYLGEGVFGLARSFLLAGAKTVVSSLWDVEDRAASRFMTLFYDSLRAGEAKDQALRTARTTMAQEGFPHRDRSAFVLAGVGTGTVALGSKASNAFDPSELTRNPIFAVGALLALLVVAAMAINAMRGAKRR